MQRRWAKITYEYKCTNRACVNHNEFEVEAKMSDESLKICPICGCKVNRVYSSVNVNLVFRGSYNSSREHRERE